MAPRGAPRVDGGGEAGDATLEARGCIGGDEDDAGEARAQGGEEGEDNDPANVPSGKDASRSSSKPVCASLCVFNSAVNDALDITFATHSDRHDTRQTHELGDHLQPVWH
eukprot:5860170-Pyramimonas_sp.AAC.1